MADPEFEGARYLGAGTQWARRLMTGLIAVLALAGFTAVVLYFYDSGGGDGNVPLIKAESGPYKARPQKPGGMSVPDQDMQVFSRLDPGQAQMRVERLLPPPEEAVAPPPPPQAMPAPRLTGVEPAKIPAVPAEPVAEPAPVKTPAKIKTAPKPVARAKPKPAAKTAAKQVAKKPKAPPKAVRQSAALPTGYRVQIASYRSRASVKRRWAELRRKHADILGNRKLIVGRADLGPGKGVYYRLQVGPLADSAAARALCRLFKKRKLGCLVVAP
jgi:cell division septation protein DedD